MGRRAVPLILAKLNPGTAALSTVYNAVTWLANEAGKFSGMTALATSVAGGVVAVAQGQPNAGATLSNAITSFLDNALPAAISFGASQLNIGNLPQKVSGKVQELRSYPRAKLEAALKGVASKARAALGLGNPEYRGLVGRVLSFSVEGEDHRLWVVNVNGRAVVMRASTGLELDLDRDLPNDTPAPVAADVRDKLAAVKQTAQPMIAAGRATAAQNANLDAKLQALKTALVAADATVFSKGAGPASGPLTEAQLQEIKAKLVGGSKIVLRPDSTYTVTTEGHTVTYETDEKGRLAEARFSITDRRPPNTRLAKSNDTAPIGHLGQRGDIGFHLVGDQFYGGKYYPNLVPASHDLNKYNSGAFGKLEALWSRALGNGKTVTNVVVGLEYPTNNNLRPSDFTIEFTVGGRTFQVQLPNRAGATIDSDTLAAITQAVS